MTDLKQRKWKPEEGNGSGEQQCVPGWESGDQQNQAGQRNRSEKDEQMETAGEGVQEHREEQPSARDKDGAATEREPGGRETSPGTEISRS